MKNFMEQNLETVDKHKMTIDELLFLQNLQEDLQKAEITCNGAVLSGATLVSRASIKTYEIACSIHLFSILSSGKRVFLR